MDSIIITGSGGYIGSRVCSFFQKKKYNVIPYSRQKLYEMNEADFSGVDYIIHCAAYGNYADQDNEMLTIDANFQLLYNLLTITARIKYKAFINFSSSSVLLPHETFYSATKAAGERIVRAFVNKYNKPVVTIRPYTVIGVGEQEAHLIPQLIHSCNTGMMIPFVGEPVHDYIDVDDVISAVDTAMLYAHQLKGQAVNVGSGIMTSNEAVKGIVERATGKEAVIRRIESMRQYDTEQWRCEHSELSQYGWKPEKTLETTIAEMVQAYEFKKKNITN